MRLEIKVLHRGHLSGSKDNHLLCSEAVIHGDQTIILQPDGQQVSYDSPKLTLVCESTCLRSDETQKKPND